MKRRFINALLALVAAWTVSTMATLPFQMSDCLRNSDGDMHTFRQLLPLVLMIWSVWTASLSALGWAIVALPFALLVSPAWIYLKRRWILLGAVLGPLAFTTFYFEAWRAMRAKHAPIDKHNYLLYSAFTVFYATSMAVTYTWLAGRPQRPSA